MTSPSSIINEACTAITQGQLSSAKDVITKQYPFSPLHNPGRRYTDHQKTEVFLSDGFVDRYSGERLVFPPVLRLLSNLMPEEFPFHKNWKMSECHLAYWQLLPTIDHVVPVSRGGADDYTNWVCTSQMRNSIKSNWLLEEIGWQLHPPGNLTEWDGLLGWFMAYAEENQQILDDSYLLSWHRAAKKSAKS